jgi:hypothetical protein
MVASPLVEPQISDGGRLLEALENHGFPVRAALWLFRPEPGVWRLIIATPRFHELGPREAYRRIQAILTTQPSGLRLDDLSVVSPNDPVVQAILRAQGPGVTGMRFSGTFTGVYDDAYIYKLT